MFINNKYNNWYTSLIASALNREIDQSVYTEKHHIIPKCMGGPDTPDNLVRLTAKEHFIAHLLLSKMTEGIYQRKMSFALWRMTQDNPRRNSRYKVTSTQYENIKKLMAQAASEHNKGRRPSEDEKQRIREGLARSSHKRKGIKRSEEFKQKLSKSRTGIQLSNHVKKRISEGIKEWNERRKGTSSSLKGRKIPRYTSIIQDTITKEEFIVINIKDWLQERGLKKHAIQRGTCHYVLLRRFLTRTGEEIPIKRK